jgi:hypothetical protein
MQRPVRGQPFCVSDIFGLMKAGYGADSSTESPHPALPVGRDRFCNNRAPISILKCGHANFSRLKLTFEILLFFYFQKMSCNLQFVVTRLNGPTGPRGFGRGMSTKRSS